MNGLAARRAVLRLALGSALLPVFASRLVRAAEAAGSVSGPINPPAGDMIYRRTVQRPLPGGAALSVTRDYRVRFRLADSGFRLEGQQVAARVQAPENLATLARLEEQRVERAIFPLALDARGQIVDGADTLHDGTVAAAIVETQRRFAQDGAEVAQLLDALSSASSGITAHLPRDLFAPQQEETEQRETIDLPWGMAGEVRVRFAASRTAETGLMRQATREVLTVLEGEERRNAELWELFPA